ncbi:2Fe-2S iron-sulfur cluster-binding protein [Vibrio vulnificus]
MSHRIRLLPQEITFDVEVGETILQAALNNGITIPNRCQIGSCAMCMCRKVSGEVRYQLEPLLTEKEQQQGWVFPCLAYAESNLVLTFDNE